MPGSEIVCFLPRELAEVDIVHRFIMKVKRTYEDDLAAALSSRLAKLTFNN